MKKHIHSLAALTLMWVFFIGCSHVSSVPDYSLLDRREEFAVEKIFPLDVALVLSPSVEDAKWEIKLIGDTFLLDIGPQLSKNCNELAELLYKKVSIVKNKSENKKDVDAYLTPKVVAIERALGGTRGDETSTTLILEWTLESADGDLIWIETVKGVGSGEAPQDDETVNEMLLSMLFKNSFQSMKASPEIQRFAVLRGSAEPEKIGPASGKASPIPTMSAQLANPESNNHVSPSESKVLPDNPVSPQKLKPNMMLLYNGETIWDLNGDWDAWVEYFGIFSGFGSWKMKARITQKGDTFEIIQMSDSTHYSKGTISMKGVIEKDGHIRADIYTSRGSFPIWGDVLDNGNKLVFDNLEWARSTYKRK